MEREAQRVAVRVTIDFGFEVPEHEVESFFSDDSEVKETAIWNVINSWQNPQSPRDIEESKYVNYFGSEISKSESDDD